MLRFDFFSDAFYPDWTGGLQRYATELAAVAMDHGHEGVLWTREWRSDGLEEVSAAVGGGALIHNVLSRLPKYMRGPALTAAAIFGSGMGQPTGDCMVFHTSVLGAAFMRRKRDRAQIYVFHASAGHELLVETASRGKVNVRTKVKAAFLLHLERKCIQSADVVVVLSEFSRKLLQELHPKLFPRVVVIPGGTNVLNLDSEMTRRTQSRRSRRIVVLRRLEWRMGIDILLHAFAASRAREAGWNVDIVGTGSQEESLRNLADNLGISGSVTFHGRVSEERKTELLDAATLSVLPTRALEGFGLATVEAMARGVIPIVTSAGASPEIVESLSPRLVCEPTVDSICRAIDYWALERSDAELAELSGACRTRAQDYGWKPVFSAYRALVADLADGRVRTESIHPGGL